MVKNNNIKFNNIKVFTKFHKIALKFDVKSRAWYSVSGDGKRMAHETSECGYRWSLHQIYVSEYIPLAMLVTSDDCAV